MAVSGISAASENAAPGDALYGVKRSTERAQLAMAGSDVTRGQLSLTFARNRLAEAAAMKSDNPKFRQVLGDMDNDTRQGVKLLTTSAVTRKDKTTLTSIDSFVQDQRRVLDPKLDRLGGDNRERAKVSLDLLDSVHDRAANLRAGLACDEVTQSGGDAIGPKLRECTTGAASTSPGTQQGQGQGQGQKQGKAGTGTKSDAGQKAKPKSTKEPTVEPTTGDPAVSPRSGEPTTDAPAPLIAPEPVDDVTGEQEDRGLLGGLLPNIFGG
jgi:hypothetical protein